MPSRPSLGAVSKRVHVCGLHVHVAMPDPAQRDLGDEPGAGLPAAAAGAVDVLAVLAGGRDRASRATARRPTTRARARACRSGSPTLREFERFVEKMQSGRLHPGPDLPVVGDPAVAALSHAGAQDRGLLHGLARHDRDRRPLPLPRACAGARSHARRGLGGAPLSRQQREPLAGDPLWPRGNMLDPAPARRVAARLRAPLLERLLRAPWRWGRHANSTASPKSCCAAPAPTVSSRHSTPRSRLAPATTRPCIAWQPTSRHGRARPETGRRGGGFRLSLAGPLTLSDFEAARLSLSGFLRIAGSL